MGCPHRHSCNYYCGHNSGNPAYDAAWYREQRRLQRLWRDANRQRERAEMRRAIEDAREGIYQPW